jgi:hypothetical protein
MQRWTCTTCGRSHDSEVIRLPIGCGCGKVDRIGESIVNIESKEKVALLPTFEKVKRYSKSTLKWIEAGRPQRTDAEVNRIFSECCSPCKWFRDATCTHKNCGCQIRNTGAETITIFGFSINAGFANNKLRRSTENCPIGKW